MKKYILVFLIMSCIIISNIPIVVSCTVFHASNENVALGGNNEDWSDPDTHIYFIPQTDTEFGRAIVGYTGNYWIQGGMNEKGLFWDGLATPYLEVINSSNKPYFNGHIFDYILSVCETCDEAIEILNQYNMKILERAQILMGDKYGDSFIIEGDVIHRKSDYFQISTNFYLSEHPNPPYPCWRYNTALDMFLNNNIADLSVDFSKSVLDAVHQEGAYPTQYSTVYDLKNGLIYLYHYHDFDNVVILNLTEELELGFHSYSIPSLFLDDDWFYYSDLPNYAPNGMPDFDQKQNNWRDPINNGWTFCGAVSVSNILWYLDSFFSDSSGIPGDGDDIFPLVLDYHGQGESNPGPSTDDHNINNVNDLTSNWDQEGLEFGNELVERVAWYVDTNGCRTGNDIWGTNLNSMYYGVLEWLEDVGLSQYFQVEMIYPPEIDSIPFNYNLILSDTFDNAQGILYDPLDLTDINQILENQEVLTFHNIASKVINGSFIVLGINGMDEDKNIHFAHWVSIAGISISQSQIALSDPYFDNANHTFDYTLHNDAAFISHDIYDVNTTSPFPDDADYWWLEDYLPNLYSIIPAALIITPLTDNIPEVSPISFFIKPDEGFIFINEDHILPTILGKTIIFGDITFEANAFSKYGIDKIEFYVNDELKYVDSDFPFEWVWDEKSFGRYNIKIHAIDNSGAVIEKNIRVLRFF
jgi:hypothetical protein